MVDNKDNKFYTVKLSHESAIYITHSKIAKSLNYMPHMHYHPDYELFYIISGDASFIINDTCVSLSDGDLLLIPPNTIHRSFYPSHKYTDRIELCISPDILDKNTKEILEQLLTEYHRNFPLKYRSKTISLLKSIMDEVNFSDKPFSLTLAKAYVYEILVHLFRHSKSTTTQSKNENPIIQNVIEYVEKNYSDDLSIPGIAKKFNISESNLYRVFNQHTNMSINNYINFIRINKAETLLLETDLSITEVAFRCGFNDGNYFSTVFKKYNGNSPSNFKKRIKNND